jgi:mono/diheme cytochrome c family protein
MIFRLLCIVAALALASASHGSDARADSYQRCAACHLPTGDGIPGAFPPLKGRIASIASSDAGRTYLVAVVQGGLMGSITVNGTPYMGVMPAQGSSYDAVGISDVLNYSVQVIDKESAAADWKPFSADEVASVLEEIGAITGQGSAKLRQALLEKHPELQ